MSETQCENNWRVFENVGSLINDFFHRIINNIFYLVLLIICIAFLNIFLERSGIWWSKKEAHDLVYIKYNKNLKANSSDLTNSISLNDDVDDDASEGLIGEMGANNSKIKDELVFDDNILT